MRDGMKTTRVAALLFIVFAACAILTQCSFQELFPSSSAATAPQPLAITDGDNPPPGGQVAIGWGEMPLTPKWGMEESDANPFVKREGDSYDYYKAVPAPDGGIYVFVSGQMVSASTANVYVEHYDKDLNYVTSPDLGLYLLGFSAYAEQHKLHIFDVMKSGENYYLAFVCWDHSPNTLYLIKYDKDLKPIYGPVFIDFGDCPALVEANGNIYILYYQKYMEAGAKARTPVIFRMTVVERMHKIDGIDRYFIHKTEREILPLQVDNGAFYNIYPSVAYNAGRKEFCVVYNSIKEKYVWGDHCAQLFDENWQKKGAMVNISTLARNIGKNEKPTSVIPSVTVSGGNYIFFLDGHFGYNMPNSPKTIESACLLKADKDLKYLSGRPLYAKMQQANGSVLARKINSCDVFNYDGGLAAIAVLASGASVLYKLDNNLNVQSATLLTGGIPRKADLFVNVDAIEKYPPKGLLGCQQMLRIPVDNRGMKDGRTPTVELYYGGQKVASGTVKGNAQFGRRKFVELTWTVPDNLQQQEIDLQVKVDPEEKIDEYTRANNVINFKMPVWDKGMARGYLCDGSIGVIDWMPLGGAKATLTAPGYSATATADKTGYYEFDRVPFGNYHIKIEKAGYNSFEADRQLKKVFPVLTFRDLLDSHGKFEIEVKPANAAAGCTVLLSSDRFQDIDAEKVGGKYVAEVPAGNYRVKVTAPGFLPYENTEVQIHLGQTTSLSVTMEEATLSIVSGFVCDEYGDPIANVSVTFTQKGWQAGDNDIPSYTVQADANGNFQVELTGYDRQTESYVDTDGKTKTRIIRGDKVKGSVSWNLSATGPNNLKYSDTFIGRTGYEEYCEIYVCEPDAVPQKTGVINAYVPWTAKSDFPGYMLYPELHASAWYGLFATGVTADYNPKKNELITLYVGMQGMAYEAHAVSGKFSSVSEPKSTGWKKWGTYAWRVGSKLWKLKSTMDEPPDTGNKVPSMSETFCSVLKENLGKTLFIPGVDEHMTSVRVDLVQVLGRTGDNKDQALWDNKDQWYSHTADDDDNPNTHLVEFRMPKGLKRNQVQVVVYLKIQKLLPDGTPDGLVPFYLNQYIKLVWYPDSNSLKAYYETEYNYLKITGLNFE